MYSFTRAHLCRHKCSHFCSLLLLFHLVFYFYCFYVQLNPQNIKPRKNFWGSTDCKVPTSATRKESRMTIMLYSQYMHVCCSHIHMLHVLQLTTWEFSIFILVLSYMQHEAVWTGSGISAGSAADIVRLTHYKWICNPRVDLNCVYCHGGCVCVHAFLSVSAQLHLFPSVTNSFVHIIFPSYDTNHIAD